MVELIVLGAFALALFVCVGLGVSILYALISYLTGTAFGTAATMGVICAALAAGMGIPAVYIGGAVISGSYFGDRCSPMSTSALLVSSLTGTDIYRNLGGMVKTSLVPFFVSVALYALLGLGLHGSYDVSQMQALFSGTFKLTLAVMLTHQLCLNVEPDRRRLALDLENTVIVVAPLIPWSIAGAVPLAAIGAPEGSLLFSFYLYLIPLCCLARSLFTRRREQCAAGS